MLLLDAIFDANGHLSFYDGFLARFISMDGPVRGPSDYGIWRYATPRDGRHLLYLARRSQSDNGTLALFDLARPRDAGNPNHLHPFELTGSSTTFELVANRDASYALRFVESPFAFEPSSYTLVRTVPYGSVALGVAANVFPLVGVFNPVTDEFYVTANVSTATPPAKNNSTFSTLFAGRISNPALVQIGSSLCAGRRCGLGPQCSNHAEWPLRPACGNQWPDDWESARQRSLDKYGDGSLSCVRRGRVSESERVRRQRGRFARLPPDQRSGLVGERTRQNLDGGSRDARCCGRRNAWSPT